MNFGRWHLGWSRNVAIGVIWTSPRMDEFQIAIMFLGITLSRGLPIIKSGATARRAGP